MELSIKPGKYVLAVSGGVDSVVLLELMAKLKPVVAHFDHGIRPDSAEDAEFVRGLAKKYGLEFELGQANLGPKASEAAARQARYEFLNLVCAKHDAKLVTAHHQDDLLETAIINILRGTGPHGIVNMLSIGQIERPLLMVPKADILNYAASHNLEWREDSTNADETYLRNHVRMNILPKLGADRQRLLSLLLQTAQFTAGIDVAIKNLDSWLFKPGSGGLIRQRFVQLDFKAACYVVRYWLFKSGATNIDKQLIERVVVAAKTLQPGKQIDLEGQHVLKSQKTLLQIDHPSHV